MFAYDLGGPEGRDTVWGPEANPEGDARAHDRAGELLYGVTGCVGAAGVHDRAGVLLRGWGEGLTRDALECTSAKVLSQCCRRSGRLYTPFPFK